MGELQTLNLTSLLTQVCKDSNSKYIPWDNVRFQEVKKPLSAVFCQSTGQTLASINPLQALSQACTQTSGYSPVGW